MSQTAARDATDPLPPVAGLLAAQVQGRIVDFVRLARGNGFRVGVAEEIDAQRVAACCGIQSSEALRSGLRALLCSGREDWERFNALFDRYWLPANARSLVQGSGSAAGRGTPSEGAGSGAMGLPDRVGDGDGAGSEPEAPQGGASARERLVQADFASLTDPGEQRMVARLAESLARRMRRRLVRRERIERKGRRLDLRHSIRASLPYGGMPLHLVHRDRRRRQPRLILILDVSRSMALYSLLFLRFARGMVSVFKDADAFAVHTRLVPIADALRRPDQRRVAESLALISTGWSGGTKLGESLAVLERDHGSRLNRRTLVVIVSDGLDTGDPAELGGTLARLRGRCRRIVWLNPLLGKPGYEPRTGAMLAALPHLDLFAPAHNLESLAALESALAEV